MVWSKLYRTEMVRKHNIMFDSTLSSNDVLFSIKCDFFAETFAVERKVIYSWDFNSNSITTSMSKKRFSDVYDVYIRENNFYRENLSSIEYKKIRNSAAKLSGIALVRYKFGFFYSLGLFIKLIGNKLVPIRLTDIKIDRLSNFFRNNQFYKKEVD